MQLSAEDVEAIVASLGQRMTGARSGTSLRKVEALVEKAVAGLSNSGGSYTGLDSPHAIDSGTAVKAWTTFDASGLIPDGARYAWVWSRCGSREGGDQVSVDFRKDVAGGTWPGSSIEIVDSASASDRDSGRLRVPLTPGRTFDYQATGTMTAGTTHWEIALEGYE